MSEEEMPISRLSNDIKSDKHPLNPPHPENSRQHIAYTMVGGYIFLLTMNIIIPVGMYACSILKNMTEVKDLMLAISSAISSIVGVLGFIMGYYFKSKEDEEKKK